MISLDLFKRIVVIQSALLNGFTVLYSDNNVRLKLDDDYDLCCESTSISSKTGDIRVVSSKLFNQPDFKFYIKWAKTMTQEYFDELCYDLKMAEVQILEGVDLI